jgi:hypothetical protein
MSLTYALGGRRSAAAFAVVLAAFVLLAIAAGRPQAAAAGGPRVWTDISGSLGAGAPSLIQPDAARGSGGVLHVVWGTKGTPEYLMYRQVAADGSLPGAVQTITPGGWGIVGKPAILAVPTGSGSLQIFAGGQSPGAALEGLIDWTSSDNGASFSSPALVTKDGTAYGSDVSAVSTGATTFQAWANTFGVFTHMGTLPGGVQDMNDLGVPGGIGYNSALGYDAASNSVYVVSQYLTSGKSGLWARQIDPATGLAFGSSFQLPDSATDYLGTPSFSLEDTRTPVAGLVGQPAVIVAYPAGYPTPTQLRVWRISPAGGAPATTVLAGGPYQKDATAVAADPNGKAWVVWTDRSGDGTRRSVFASRSNVGATAWGKIVSLKGPVGTDTLWQLAASAQSDRVDVLAQYGEGGGNAIFHTQVLAGLSVTATPTKVKVGKKVTVKVTVKDAGDPVAGAKVTIGSKNRTTSASGLAKVKVKPVKAGKLQVKVTKAGYATASLTLTVKR